MAWGTKYSIEFKDVNDVTWLIYFAEEDWGGAVTALTPSHNPLNITWNQSEKYQPIIGSTVDIEVVYQSEVDSLYAEGSNDILVGIYRAGTEYWKGYLSPGQYYRSFNRPMHYITLTCSDGLGELKNCKFEDGNGDPYYYSMTEIEVIVAVLAKTGTLATIYDAINIFEDDYNAAATDSPLAQTYIWPEMYWDEITDERADCYTVLSDILKKYGATIRWSYGHWYILRPNDYSSHANISYRVFSSLGNYLSNSSFSTTNTVGSSMYYIRANQELSRLPGVGSAEVSFTPYMRQNALPNGTFDSFTWNGGSVLNAPYYWTNQGTTASSYDNTKVEDTITFYSNSDTSQPTNYLESPIIQVYSAKSIRVTIEYRCYYQMSPTYARVCVGLIFGAGKYYEPSSDSWSSTSYAAGTSAVVMDMIDESKASMLTYETIVIEPSSGPFDPNGEGRYGFGNYMKLRLYEFWCENGGVNNWVSFSRITVEIDRDSAFPSTQVYEFDNPINTVNNIHSEELNLADTFIPSLSRGSDIDYIYYGVTSDAEGVPNNETDAWYIKGHATTVGTPEPIATLLARQYVEGQYKSLDVIRGSIRSAYYYVQHMAFEDPDFTDPYGFNKTFFPMGINYNARLNEYSGEWVECPALYTDEEMEWDSHDCGGDAVITGNEIEINSWTAPSGGVFAYFDSYTAVAGETIRLVYDLQNDGGSNTAYIVIDGNAQARAWGTNYYTYTFDTAGTYDIEMGTGNGYTLNLTATLDIYSITGV